ncbi:CBS domain-containing protein [Halalkalicoccus salilacus]|uniref:CBS domain-containing protein n=1 Tax=Halalkalicoccus salilacus TaxID=3117459 RepID=UPI00300E7267
MFDITVSELMNRTVRTIGCDTTVLEAATKLYDHDIGSLVVVDNGAHPVGIVTKSDINMVVAEDETPNEVAVRTVMSSPPICVGATDTIHDAAELMQEHSIKKLPVTDEEGTLVGVLTAGDLAYYLPTYAKRIHSRRPARKTDHAVLERLA